MCGIIGLHDVCPAMLRIANRDRHGLQGNDIRLDAERTAAVQVPAGRPQGDERRMIIERHAELRPLLNIPSLVGGAHGDRVIAIRLCARIPTIGPRPGLERERIPTRTVIERDLRRSQSRRGIG